MLLGLECVSEQGEEMKGSRSLEQTSTRRWEILLASAAMIAALVAGCGASGSPDSGPGAAGGRTASTAAAAKTTFTSKRYRYSIALPGGSARYETLGAHTSWSGSVPNRSNPAFDHISDLHSGRFLLIAAKRVVPGMTLRKWMSYLVSVINPGCTYAKQTFTESTLGGAPALGFKLRCSEGITLQLGTIHAHRAYFFIDITSKPKLHPSDRRAFDVLRRSFRFSS